MIVLAKEEDTKEKKDTDNLQSREQLRLGLIKPLKGS
jgi:hypothetical protein